jgi:hypothetical protein
MIEKRMNLGDWIFENTKGCNTVVEFGAMFGERLLSIHPSVKNIFGLEIHQPYIDKFIADKKYAICCDMSRYHNYVPTQYFDCAMFIDSLEHLFKDKAIHLINEVKKDFNKILLMIPEGNHPQSKDVFEMGADEYQTHRSTWYVSDIIDLGFQSIILDSQFHGNNGEGKDEGCVFAVWNK